MKLFVPITKIDEINRTVYGTMVAEIIDKSGEVFDYITSKGNFIKWSNEISLNSGGKSLGNVRAMHGKIAAGKLIDIVFDDVSKKIDAVAKIIDEIEWQKCLEGVYTGFSIGGRYEKRWVDDVGNKRYTAMPSEVSIVDNPCCPIATFSMVKADGNIEEVPFKKSNNEEEGGTLMENEDTFEKALMDIDVDQLAKRGAKLSTDTINKLIKIHCSLGDFAMCKCEKCVKYYREEKKEEKEEELEDEGKEKEQEKEEEKPVNKMTISELLKDEDVVNIIKSYVQHPPDTSVIERFESLEKSLNGLKEENKALADSVVAYKDENKVLLKQVQELKDTPVSGGPKLNSFAVFEKHLSGAQNQNVSAEPDVAGALKKVMENLEDPMAKQVISQEMAKLAMKQSLASPIYMTK